MQQNSQEKTMFNIQKVTGTVSEIAGAVSKKNSKHKNDKKNGKNAVKSNWGFEFSKNY